MEIFQTAAAAGLTILAIIIGVMVLFSLLFGALCLHLSTKLLGFRDQSFRRAFLTHLLLALLSLGMWGLSHALNASSSEGGAEPLRWWVFALLLVLALGPTLIVKSAYNCSFIAALIATFLTGIVESALGVVLMLGLVATLVVATPVIANQSAAPEPAPVSPATELAAEESDADAEAAREQLRKLNALVGRSFETLETGHYGTLSGVSVTRREGGSFVVRHSKGIARISGKELLRSVEAADQSSDP